MTEINISNLTFFLSILTVLGVLFSIYKAFKDPDVKADKEINLLRAEVEKQKEINLQMLKTNQNCIHSLELEVKALTTELNNTNLIVAKLATIIDERIPKKL